MRALPGVLDVLHCAAISSDGKTIYGGGHDGAVYVWNSEGKLKTRFSPPEESKIIDTTNDRISQASKTVLRTAGAKSSVNVQNNPERPLSFINDVLPVLSKAGCNSGSCHAKAEGQNGFKLSVFAYDPKSDYRQIVKDVRLLAHRLAGLADCAVELADDPILLHLCWIAGLGLTQHLFHILHGVGGIVQGAGVDLATHASMTRLRFHRHADRDGRDPRAGLRGTGLVTTLPVRDEERLLDGVLDLVGRKA